MAEVVISQLSKTYADKTEGTVTAVKGINLTVKDGEFVVLVGASGCGKSTTLRMIAGLEEISGGTVTIGGRIVNDVLPKDRDIAMVFQNYALYPHMTVFENMAFGLKLQKVPAAEIKRRVLEAAAQLGLEQLLERRPKALSGGQRQRVAVGRAIVRQPKVFLFDEPLSNLDAKMRGSMRAEISRLHARLGATMIYVTHDQIEAMTMGDRICVMRDGEILQVDAPLQIYNHPANLYVAGFIGSPPMNLLRGEIKQDPTGCQFVETNPTAPPLVLPLPTLLANRVKDRAGQSIILGIRPEDIREAETTLTSGGPTFPLLLELAEPMGAETYLHLTTGRHALVARVRPTEHYRDGQTLRMGFDPEKIHFFDATTEQAIR
jgi:multiple sugar transport system ATP-binding protein